MEAEVWTWLGLGLSFVVIFLLSLFHHSLAASTRISISRALEDKAKPYRLKILDIYDELKVSVEILRILFIIAFLVYIYTIFTLLQKWPLWLFLLSLGIYLVFFEVLPRLLCSINRKTILDFFLPSYKIPFFLMKPFLWLTKTKSIPRESEESREASDEEIQALIEEAKEEGIIEKEEGSLLKSVVEFGDTIVKEIMTPRVSMICIRKDATIEKLRDVVIREKHSRIPVYRERIDNIEGITIAKDLLEYSDDAHRKTSIEPLIRPVSFIPESMKVTELLKELQKKKQKLAIVVDEHGGVSGLVTMEDLVEEIVGEIQDEYDKDEGRIVQKGPLDYVVSGETEVFELEDIFDLELEDDDFITIGGLITHNLGRFPEPGENLEIKGLSLEILEVDEKRIRKLRVKKKTPEEPPK